VPPPPALFVAFAVEVPEAGLGPVERPFVLVVPDVVGPPHPRSGPATSSGSASPSSGMAERMTRARTVSPRLRAASSATCAPMLPPTGATPSGRAFVSAPVVAALTTSANASRKSSRSSPGNSVGAIVRSPFASSAEAKARQTVGFVEISMDQHDKGLAGRFGGHGSSLRVTEPYASSLRHIRGRGERVRDPRALAAISRAT
jgi:hypothetical protein